MAQYRDSRNYRRGEQRNDNEVIFRDGKPVTYASRQERGGRRPEAGEKATATKTAIIIIIATTGIKMETASASPIIKSGTMPRAALTGPKKRKTA